MTTDVLGGAVEDKVRAHFKRLLQDRRGECVVYTEPNTVRFGDFCDGGAIVLNDDDLYARLKFLQNAAGAVPGPMDCFLTLRGIKTLAIRMERHCENGLKVAQFLADHTAVAQVIYPGLPSHPQYELAQRQMKMGGGMISFVLHGGEAAARHIANNTKLFTLAESLGGVESLIELPAPMTHASVADSPLAVDPGLVRVSVGIENANDLIRDLAQALHTLPAQ